MPPKRFGRPRGRGVLLVTQTDERLVELVRAGDVRAFEEIVRRYRRRLRAYCRRLVPEPAADDAVQQAFLNAYAAMRRNGVRVRLGPWLFRIARNAAFDTLREMGSSAEQLDSRNDGVEGPDQAAERREDLRRVLAGVASLPERQRAAIILREFDGRSYDEIAARLGVSDGAVRQLLNRARTKLRASATALLPLGLVLRWRLTGVGPRVAELCAQAGGGAAAGKLCVALLASGGMVAGDAHLSPRGGGASQAVIASDGGQERDRTGASGAAQAEQTDGRAGEGGPPTGLPQRGRPLAVRLGHEDRDRAAPQGGERREREEDESVATGGGTGDTGGVQGRFGDESGEVEEDGDGLPRDDDEGPSDYDRPGDGDRDDRPGDDDEGPDDDGGGDEDGEEGDEGPGDDDGEDREPDGDEDGGEKPDADAAEGQEPAGDDRGEDRDEEGSEEPDDDADDGTGGDADGGDAPRDPDGDRAGD